MVSAARGVWGVCANPATVTDWTPLQAFDISLDPRPSYIHLSRVSVLDTLATITVPTMPAVRIPAIVITQSGRS